MIVDSCMTYDQAIDGLDPSCPVAILQRIQLIDVRYFSFDGQPHKGQLLVNSDVVSDITHIFELIYKLRFPVFSAIPISDLRFREGNEWSDSLSMQKNNTSCFNYRHITHGSRLSLHSYGLAIDINPYQNVYMKDDVVLPDGATYAPERQGSLTIDSAVTRAFMGRGWDWGGTWDNPVDYQHFEKRL